MERLITKLDNLLMTKMDRRQFLIIMGKIIITILILTSLPLQLVTKRKSRPRMWIVGFNPHNLKMAKELAG